MNTKPGMWSYVHIAALLVLAVSVLAPAPAHAAEIIQIRTGQVGGVPGTCPNPDDGFTYLAGPCAAPLRSAPFTAANFAAAAAGPPARVITPILVYLPTLAFDPQARWINPQPQPGCVGGIAASALYAYRFTVNTPCNPTAQVQACWAVDDWLGDPAGNGANPVGIYINGVPLNPGFSGGNYAAETCFSQTTVPVNTGTNYIYVYQRDLGCSVSGLILSVRLSVTSTTCPNILVTKFNDVNGNGIQDGGEAGLPGWQINATGPANLNGTTDANGQVLFTCVPLGTYQVTEVNQPGWIQTYPIGGVQILHVTCGQDYAASFGNRQCNQGQGQCTPLPSCLTAWWPFDECAGTVANEVVANRDGTISGGSSNPTWTGGRWGTPCSIGIPGLPGTQVVTMSNAPEHNFGTGSFTISAWVRTNANDGQIHTILDKRVTPFGTPTGYVLYHVNGILRLQYGSGSGAPITIASTAPPITDGIWHTVGVSVCRNPNNPSANTATLFVDYHNDTFGSASVPAGNLSNTAGLQFGDQCPGFITGIPFSGMIDDVLLFKCCLRPGQIAALHNDFPYCNDNCYVPSILGTAFGTVTTALTLCNYSTTPQTYTWSIAGLPAGSGCSVNGPTWYAPASGTITIPAATSGPACVNIPIMIHLPAGMVPGQTTCYQITTQNNSNGRCCVTRGRIRKTWPWHVYGNPPYYTLPPNTPVSVGFVVRNAGQAGQNFSYQLVGHSSDGDDSNQVVRLNGLPPGIPVTGTLSIAAGDSATVTVQASLDAFQPLNINEIVLSADSDGDGTLEDVTSVALESAPEGSAADVPGTPGQSSFASLADELSAYPNPFHGRTGIQLTLAQSRSSVRVEIYDVGGRLVRSLFDGALAAGIHQFPWDGRDEQGRTSGQGLYFVRVHSGSTGLKTKLIRLE